MSDPADVITGTWGGDTFRTGRRTAAHLDATFEAFARRFPTSLLMIAQGSYNTGVVASKFTHDFDGVIDFEVFNLDWWIAQRFLREMGWFCWFRHTGTWAARDDWHIHGISGGCPGPLGLYVDGGLSQFGRVTTSSQVDDYYRHSLGLKGQHDSGLDDSWFPPDIDSTIFDYPAWEDRVTPEDMAKILAAIPTADEVAQAVLEAEVRKKTSTKNAVTLRRAVRESFEAVEK